MENRDVGKIAKRFDGEDTPTNAYFPKCGMAHCKSSIEECKKPSLCEEWLDTDRILDFDSGAMMAKSGVGGSLLADEGEAVSLTTVEYENCEKRKIVPMN